MGRSIGGEIGRARRAKGWILYRLEDEIALATGRYAAALREQHALLKNMDVSEFAPIARQSTLVRTLWVAQRQAGMVKPGDNLIPPLAETVQEAIR